MSPGVGRGPTPAAQEEKVRLVIQELVRTKSSTIGQRKQLSSVDDVDDTVVKDDEWKCLVDKAGGVTYKQQFDSY